MTTNQDAGVVTVRLFAAARAAAGTGAVALPSGTVTQVVAGLVAIAPGLERVLGSCSLICDGVRLERTSQQLLAPGSVLDVLPPFAGG